MTIAPQAPVQAVPDFLELEITGRCQLECTHCYAESGPARDHGVMSVEDWTRVITEAAAGGAKTVQLIGGEPTLRPAFAALVGHALEVGLRVQVYSNLYRVRAEHWDLFAHPQVSLSTSYYSDDPAEHDTITGRKGLTTPPGPTSSRPSAAASRSRSASSTCTTGSGRRRPRPRCDRSASTA
ncbi:radical SAM protein [Streptomyces poriferorum]|uniref:radical SAM protein n=1 Tax=Streptomyces poriferorum TaxID=2798799 RepID=UPI0035320B19